MSMEPSVAENEHTRRDCPVMRAMGLLLWHMGAMAKYTVDLDEDDRDCIGQRCGAFRLCSGAVSVADGPGQRIYDLVYPVGLPGRKPCPKCGKQVRVFQNGRIARHKNHGGVICAGYREQRDMGEGTGA